MARQVCELRAKLASEDLAEAHPTDLAVFGAFEAFAGDPSRKWLILRNGNAIIGLFQGHFERNTLTFNPGWDSAGNTLAEFTDVRELQRRLQLAGITPATAADESTTGPAYMTVIDPDGNPILIDQHV